MRIWERRLGALLVLLLISSMATATIINDIGPSWRGDAATTSQAWGFDNDNNPADLEAGWFNPYGISDPTAEVIGVDPPLGPPDFIPPDTYWKRGYLPDSTTRYPLGLTNKLNGTGSTCTACCARR